MAKYRTPKKMMLFKGFYFGEGQLFGDQTTIRVVLDAIFGDQGIASLDTNDAKKEIEASLIILFNRLVDQADIYCALRGHWAFYETLASEFPSEGEFTPMAIKKLDDIYVAARKSNNTTTAWETPLTSAVDAWIPIKDAVAGLPALQSMNLTARPSGIDTITAQLQGASLGPPWPPAHFTPQDVSIISMNDLRPLLCGKTPQTPGTSPALPNKNTSITEIRGFLCAIALENYQPNSTWKLVLTPIAHFKTAAERRLWAAASDGQSLLCFTMEKFMVNAIHAFRSGKTTSVALATPWFGRAWGGVPCLQDLHTDAAAGQTQLGLWSSACPRMGFTIALHKYADGFELIIFDATHSYPHIKNQVKGSQTSLFDFRRLIRETTQKAVEAAGGRLLRGWWGGKVALGNDLNGDAQSVQLASEWVRQLVVAGRNGEDALSVDDDTWAQWGFEPVQM